MKIQKINTIKLNNNKQHQKINFGDNKVASIPKNNEQSQKNKIYEYTKNGFAILSILLTYYFRHDLKYFFKKLFKK